MKKELLFLTFLFCLFSHAQTPKIVFEYDAAGNQTKRYLCLKCPPATGKIDQEKEAAASAQEEVLPFLSEESISYHPNPVKETLYLKWKLKDNNRVTSVQVFSFLGQVLGTWSIGPGATDQSLPFQNYPDGTYLVVLHYSSGSQKSIKVIKN
ncbi:T9SS C-terminal target domain-containing protein [Flavobacterium circumlabens]|uniref:Secreted protein (Por secretion system target) n=1 Tax=Flavobacterium circumlabens TaxID=2133765 RepID=A0A4Y7UBW1_9FLAO|nr:T9SS type A sorting domain-containing protein [Flavobacterium circumlabens]TCN57598.1 putative secreted protein (Por secretion system target) [Flavobacterium circumlabens]TEB43906.1 T9SS C-terminal target domain-containing protein [Flavobacterium circumlabens]